MNLLPSKIDVSVLIIFFNRPGCLAQVFEQVKKARPSKLFLYQDGAREGNENDIIGIEKCRQVVSDIDWECEVHTLYQEKNFGCDPSGYLARIWAFGITDKCIILEDDCVPSQSLFPFCKELLDKYEFDERINMICCMNNLEKVDSPYSYLFTETGSICGVATWKRIIDKWDEKSSFLDNDYLREKMRDYYAAQKPDLSYRIEHWNNCRNSGIAFHETIGGIEQCANNRLNIVPTYNMIHNVGNSKEGGTHSTPDVALLPRAIRKIFTMPAYEIDFPLKHPEYMINDIDFQRKLFRLMGTKRPFVKIYRNIEKSFLLIRYQGFSSLINKLRKKFKGV